MSIDSDYEIILNSGEFDEEYYKQKYNLTNGENPIYHFLEIGAYKFYNPSKNFDTKFYLEQNPDVKNARINPFVHYLTWGKEENRCPGLIDFNDFMDESTEKKLSFDGLEDYLFLINDSNLEIIQHFDSNFVSDFDSKSFSEDISFKKNLFNSHGIPYYYFIVPDKSVVCHDLLPFKFDKINRDINNLYLDDLSIYLDKTHYFKHDTHMNYEGGKVFSSKLLNIIDSDIDDLKFNEIIGNNKLELVKHSNDLLFDFNFSGSEEERKKYDYHDIVFVEKPFYLKEYVIPEKFDYCLKRKSHYYFNENSYSDLRVLIFHDSTIESIKDYLSFYFREMFLYWDYGSLNEDLINWYNPDIVLEIRVERFIREIKSPLWVQERVDFFKEDLTTPSCDLIEEEVNPKEISVIIPVYNVDKYLKQCLDSVINQSFDFIEIICVNDGSTDNSLNILKEYAKKDNRIKIINKINQGLGAARNTGLDFASGNYIFFLDSDDWIDENALELLYDKANSKDLDVLFFKLLNYLDLDNKFSKTNLYDHLCFQENHFSLKDYFTFNDIKNNLFEIPVVAYSKLYRKSFLDDNNFRFPEGINFEDNEFFYDVFFNCKKAGFLNLYLLYRRRHDDSITGKFNMTQMDIIFAMNNTIKVFIKNDKYDEFKREIINHSFSNIMDWFNKTPLEFKEEFYNKIKKYFIGFNELKEDFNDYLSKDNLLIFNLFLDNKYYLHFDSKYNLFTAKYTIFDGSNFINPNTDEYLSYSSIEREKHYKIAVVIPIYNNNKITHRTMMSIENQSFNFDDIEVLLVNDNSSDETFDIVNFYAEKYNNVKAIHVSKSSGSSGTPRNIGICESFSEYIMFLDHDDFFELDALDKLYDEIIATNSDVVFGTYSVVEYNKVQKALAPKEKRGYFTNLAQNERLVAIPAPSIWTKLFNKNFVVENNILFPTILGEDAIFMSETLFNAEGISYLWDTNICYHNLRDSSTTNNVTLKYMEELFVSEIHMYNFYKDFGNESYYSHRGINIIDFAMNQIYRSDLNNNQIRNLFDLMRKFCLINDRCNAKPKTLENQVSFYLILNGDVEAFLNHKNNLKIIDQNSSHLKEIDLKNKQLNDSINRSNHSINKLNDSNAHLNKTVKKLKNQNSQLQSFKEDVLNSHSWKITKPLRKFGNKLKSNKENTSSKNPLLSIIIPVYNKEDFLKDSILSILEQNYDNFELICVDDCSTDNSLNILNNLSKNQDNIKIIRNKENLGSGKTRNIGIKNSKGKYLLFIDADDFIVDKSSFKQLIENAEKYDVSMVSSNLDYLTEENSILSENKYLRNITKFDKKTPYEYGVPWFFTRNLYKRDILKKNNIQFPDSRFGEDPIFLSKYLLAIDSYIEIPLEYYRYRASSEIKRNSFDLFYEDLSNIYEVFTLLSKDKKFNNTLNKYLEVFISRLKIDNYVENESQLLKLAKLYDNFLEIIINNNLDNHVEVKKLIDENIENTRKNLV